MRERERERTGNDPKIVDKSNAANSNNNNNNARGCMYF